MPPKERKEPNFLSPTLALQDPPIHVIGLLPYSSNRTFLVRLGDPNDEGGALAVYKPARGERPLHDFPDETLYKREIAAYELSRALGWDLVPETVSRPDAPLGPGSIQRFIDHDPSQHYFTLLEQHQPLFKRLATFDILCNNADRKSGHCLLDANGRIWAVDHGLTFHVEPKLRTVIWDFAGRRVPARERAAVAQLAGMLADPQSTLMAALGPLLDGEEIAALRRRVRALSQPCYFPSPDSDWSFPWPLV